MASQYLGLGELGATFSPQLRNVKPDELKCSLLISLDSGQHVDRPCQSIDSASRSYSCIRWVHRLAFL